MKAWAASGAECPPRPRCKRACLSGQDRGYSQHSPSTATQGGKIWRA
jgi:hypothetical protein